MLALSGGADSVVLFDILAKLRIPLKYHLSALYVNHGISVHAPVWGRFCANLCEKQEIPFSEVSVTLDRCSGESLEASARTARYRVFSQQATDFMVLAHHLDDQAETVMLQLLRGAGVKGLSAMPERRVGDGQMAMLRPLLEITRNEILGYARHRELEWMEDESNLDAKYDRNFLRHRVLPKLGERFPGYRTALLRVSRHAAEATALLDELACDDAASVFREGYLMIAPLRKLSAMRAKNLLRWHLDELGLPMPSAVRLDEVLRQVTQAGHDAQLRVSIGTHEIRRYRDRLYVLPLVVEKIPNYRMDWNFQEKLVLPGGTLRFEYCRGHGISLAKLKEGRCEVRSRSGKDTLRPDCRRPARSLKNLLQEAGVPPWERSGLPLLYCGGWLVWGQRIGVDCAFQAMPDEDGVLAIFL